VSHSSPEEKQDEVTALNKRYFCPSCPSSVSVIRIIQYLLGTVPKKEKQLYVIEWNATIIDRVSMSNMGELCGAIAKHKSLRKNRGKRSRLKLLRHFREFQMN